MKKLLSLFVLMVCALSVFADPTTPGPRKLKFVVENASAECGDTWTLTAGTDVKKDVKEWTAEYPYGTDVKISAACTDALHHVVIKVNDSWGNTVDVNTSFPKSATREFRLTAGDNDHDVTVVKLSFRNVKTVNVMRHATFDYSTYDIDAIVTHKDGTPDRAWKLTTTDKKATFLMDEGDSLRFEGKIANGHDRMNVTFNGDTTYYVNRFQNKTWNESQNGISYVSKKYVITNSDSIVLSERDTCKVKFRGEIAGTKDGFPDVYVHNVAEKAAKKYTLVSGKAPVDWNNHTLYYVLNTDTIKGKKDATSDLWHFVGTMNEKDTAYIVPACKDSKGRHGAIVITNDAIAKQMEFAGDKDAFKFTVAPQTATGKNYGDTCHVIVKYYNGYKVTYNLDGDTVTNDKKAENNYVNYQFTANDKTNAALFTYAKLDSTYYLPQNKTAKTNSNINYTPWYTGSSYSPVQLPDSIEIYAKSTEGEKRHVLVTINGKEIPAAAISKYAGTTKGIENTRFTKHFNVYLNKLGLNSGDEVNIKYTFKKHYNLYIETFGKNESCDTLMAVVADSTFKNNNQRWQPISDERREFKDVTLACKGLFDIDSARIVKLIPGCVPTGQTATKHPIVVFINDTLLKVKDAAKNLYEFPMTDSTYVRVYYNKYPMLLTDSLKDAAKDKWNWQGNAMPECVYTMGKFAKDPFRNAKPWAKNPSTGTKNIAWYVLQPNTKYTLNGYCADTLHHMRVTYNDTTKLATTVENMGYYCDFLATGPTRLDIKFLNHYYINVPSTVMPTDGTFKMTANGYDKKEMKMGKVNTVEEGDTVTYAHTIKAGVDSLDKQHMDVFFGKKKNMLQQKDTVKFVLNDEYLRCKSGDTLTTYVEFKKNFAVKSFAPVHSKVCEGDTCKAYVFFPYTKQIDPYDQTAAFVLEEEGDNNWKEVKNDSIVEEGSKVVYYAFCTVKAGAKDALHHIYVTVNNGAAKKDTIDFCYDKDYLHIGDTIKSVDKDYTINYVYKRHFKVAVEQTNAPKDVESVVYAVKRDSKGDERTQLHLGKLYDFDEDVDSFYMVKDEVDTMFTIPAIGNDIAFYDMPDSLAAVNYAFTVKQSPYEKGNAFVTLCKGDGYAFEVPYVGYTYSAEDPDSIVVDFGYYKKINLNFGVKNDSINPNCDMYKVVVVNHNGRRTLPNQHAKEGFTFPAELTEYYLYAGCEDSVHSGAQHHPIVTVNGKRMILAPVDPSESTTDADYRGWYALEDQKLDTTTYVNFAFANQAILKLYIDETKYVAHDDQIAITIDGQKFDTWNNWKLYGKTAAIYEGATVTIWAKSLNEDRKPALIVVNINAKGEEDYVEVPFNENTNEATFRIEAPVVAAYIAFYSATGINDVDADATSGMKNGKFLNEKNQIIIVKNGKQFTTAGHAVK